MAEPPTAPAAHTVTIKGADGGVLVGHLLCGAQPVFVPNRPGQDHVLVIDVAQAVIGHECADPHPGQTTGWLA